MNLRQRLLTLLGIASVAVLSSAQPLPEVKRVGFEFALYFAPAPKTDPEQALLQLLQNDFAGLREHLTVRHQWSPLADYAPPTPDSFRYVTVDLSMEQGYAIAQSERVFILGFESRPDDLLRANREANRLTLRLAELTAGLPWDDEARLLYSREAWQRRRVDSWDGEIPDVRGHVNMHAYRNPDLVRIITLGMRKFGLPDLVIAQTPSGNSRAAGNTVNACAQRMLEGQPFNAGTFPLVLEEIRHTALRSHLLEDPHKSATGRAALRLQRTEREEGDPQNRLLALSFPAGEGRSALEKQASALAALYGAESRVIGRAPGDGDLKAASEKARREFFAKVPQFRKGLEPNERLVVKVPFEVQDQTEFMWVEVTGWREERLEGVLMNDSHFDEKLRVGRRLSVELAKVYDYVHYKPDGTEEGNETGKVLDADR
jgi:uncharacterized protein YegJ (DUF2314 family)